VVTQENTDKEGSQRPEWLDFFHTAPDRLAGRYMRLFWHPIFHTDDLPAGRTKPVKIMNVDYNLYRGEDGKPYLTQFRCPHRGLQLSAGWVEGNAIRCMYHGWKFDCDGNCVDQPAEPKPFLDKVPIKTYPCRDYLGLVFAFLGEDMEAPPFPRYPQFEDFEGILEPDSYYRGCNYYSNLENAGDRTHSGFVHRNNPGSFDGITNAPVIKAHESIWGATVSRCWPEQVSTSQVGMPNVFHHKAQPTDPAMSIYREFLAWWTPIDDFSHTQFTVAAVRMPSDKAKEYLERREARLAKRTRSSVELGERILRGEIYLDEIDPETTDYVRLQDHVAQIGQGRIPDHEADVLGQGDVGVALIRKLWARELEALAKGKPLKDWVYDLEELSITRGELWEEQREAQIQG
jgi:5,5'-dehydrodivanillate O-demethylase